MSTQTEAKVQEIAEIEVVKKKADMATCVGADPLEDAKQLSIITTDHLSLQRKHAATMAQIEQSLAEVEAKRTKAAESRKTRLEEIEDVRTQALERTERDFNLMEEATYEEFDLMQAPKIYIRKD